jgi:hypothetical protein
MYKPVLTAMAVLSVAAAAFLAASCGGDNESEAEKASTSAAAVRGTVTGAATGFRPRHSDNGRQPCRHRWSGRDAD